MKSISSLLAASTLALAATLGVTAGAKAGPTVITFDNFNASSGPVAGAPVIAYLAGYGVTWTSTAPIAPYIQQYPSWLIPISSPNVFFGGGSANYFTYKMSFSAALESLSFTIPGQGSATMAAWSATAYSGANTVLSTAGDPNISFSGSPQETITLNGPGIAYVVFSSNAFNFAGDNLTFDNLTLSVPEPASWALMLTGFAGLGGALRMRRGKLATA